MSPAIALDPCLLDLLYLSLGTAFLIGCWFFVKACERL